LEAIQAATRNAARCLGVENRFGTIEKGKAADLVLLDADPLADIRNTRKISTVVLRGKAYSRAQLDGFVRQVQALP
jgi:imidazolonepropionase-like amidohydrolase